MKLEGHKIGSRGVLFEFNKTNSNFEHPTFVYAINADKYIFICDTHCGSFSMIPLRENLEKAFGEKPFIVFNSHYDWDHVWGNCTFADSLIASHKKCHEKLADDFIWNTMVKANKQYADGGITRHLPDLLFERELFFAQEQIHLLYTPGHTDCSSSLIDYKDRIVFAGDNIEKPLVCLQWSGLSDYIQTLQHYKELAQEGYTFIAGHNGVVEPDLIDENLDYVQKVHDGKVLEFKQPSLRAIHDFNLKLVLLSEYEEKAEWELESRFDRQELIAVFDEHMESSVEEVKQALENYIQQKDIL